MRFEEEPARTQVSDICHHFCFGLPRSPETDDEESRDFPQIQRIFQEDRLVSLIALHLSPVESHFDLAVAQSTSFYALSREFEIYYETLREPSKHEALPFGHRWAST